MAKAWRRVWHPTGFTIPVCLAAAAPLYVLGVQVTDPFKVGPQGAFAARRQHRHPILVSFPLAYDKLIGGKINVFDAEAQALQ